MTCQTHVKAGVALHIEAGGTIYVTRGDTAGRAPALIIERGAKLIAAGTLQRPITFTPELSNSRPSDDLAVVDTAEDSGTVVIGLRGKWGGVVICGRAPVYTHSGQATEQAVEGIAGVSYGGDDPQDNSGVLQYVRIWHAGAVVGNDNEINGLTFAGVGNGTVIEHVEVAFSLDDGFEWFGGTVNVRYLSSLFSGDDAFDFDQGYQGKAQFLYAQLDGQGNHGLEIDLVDGLPGPQLSGLTIFGAGVDSPSRSPLIDLRRTTRLGLQNVLLAFIREDVPAMELSRCSLPNLTHDTLGPMWLLRHGLGASNANHALVSVESSCSAHSAGVDSSLSVIAWSTEYDQPNVSCLATPCALSTSELDGGAWSPLPLAASSACEVPIAAALDAWFLPTPCAGAFSGFSASDNWLLPWSYLATGGVVAPRQPDVGTAGAVNSEWIPVSVAIAVAVAL